MLKLDCAKKDSHTWTYFKAHYPKQALIEIFQELKSKKQYQIFLLLILPLFVDPDVSSTPCICLASSQLPGDSFLARN